jgi:hypothetical protein
MLILCSLLCALDLHSERHHAAVAAAAATAAAAASSSSTPTPTTATASTPAAAAAATAAANAHTAASEGEIQGAMLDEFARWVETRQFTAVVDAPNVAYHNQNFPGGCFQIAQVQAVVKVLEARGEKVNSVQQAQLIESYSYCAVFHAVRGRLK